MFWLTTSIELWRSAGHTAAVTRFGRETSSPPQFGQVASIVAEHDGQNVHSKLQIRASPSGGSGAAHRSHSGSHLESHQDPG